MIERAADLSEGARGGGRRHPDTRAGTPARPGWRAASRGHVLAVRAGGDELEPGVFGVSTRVPPRFVWRARGGASKRLEAYDRQARRWKTVTLNKAVYVTVVDGDIVLESDGNGIKRRTP